jgi:hypothetical protein
MRALVLLLIGCGSTPAGPFARACGDIAVARCQKRSDCSGGASIVRTYGDMATCVAREKLSCELASAAPQTGSSVAHLDGCTAAYPGISCDDYFNDTFPAACSVSGQRIAGQVCTFSSQCQSDFCVENKTNSCGSCAAEPGDGTQCITSGCGRDQSCVTATLECQSLRGLGQDCDEAHPCAYGLACSSQRLVCETAVAAFGAPCGGKLAPCDGIGGLTCSSMLKSCVTILYVDDGQKCGPFADGSFVSCKTGFCYTASGIALQGQTGTCKAAAKDGASCDAVLGPPCLLPARCLTHGSTTQGTCTLPDASLCG